MPRNVEDLARGRYDVLVVGGGIHGLFAAYDAAQRGLSVALVERADFGSGLSFNHQRTLHGGLRALEGGHLQKSRRQIAERRAWARIAPHLLRPLPFLIGTYRWTRRSRWLLKAGFSVYDQIGRRRNADVSPELHLPKGRLESAAATRSLFPGVSDARPHRGRRLVRLPDAASRSADVDGRAGGPARPARSWSTTSPHVKPVTSGNRVTGAEVRDELTGRTYTIEASATLLAVGGRLPIVMQRVRRRRRAADGPRDEHAAQSPREGHRHGRAGTARAGCSRRCRGAATCSSARISPSPPSRPDEIEPPAEAVDAFLADANATFPKLAAERKDIRMLAPRPHARDRARRPAGPDARVADRGSRDARAPRDCSR